MKIHTCGSSMHAQLQFSYRTISCPNQGALSIRKSAVNLAGRRAAFDGVRKGSQVAKHSVFPSKSRLAKAAGAEPSGEKSDEKLLDVAA